MLIRSLKQLVDIVKAMTRPTQITVLGSSSLLASNPDLGEKGQPLELSLDADLLIEPCDEGQAGILHEAIGEGSLSMLKSGVINLAELQKAFQETVMNERDMFKAGRLLRRLELE